MGILHGAEMTLSYILHSVFRLIQIIMALAVCGLYGVDLNKADREHKYSDGKWVRLSLFPPPFPIYLEANTFATGLRRSNRLPLRLPRPPLPDPLLQPHPLRLGRRYDPLHPLDLALRLVWQYVYQGAGRGRCGRAEDEECGVG
jgi:hypothetical protein